jgi:hypothetical protein
MNERGFRLESFVGFVAKVKAQAPEPKPKA